MSNLNIFYVYEHWRPDTGACFYVGKGKGKRAWSSHGRNRWHTAITSKLTALGMCVDVRIIVRDLAEDTAFALERDRIAFHERTKLTNLTDGGDGPSGLVWTEEQRNKKRGMRSTLSVAARAKMGAASRGNTYRLGKSHTPKAKEKLRVAAFSSGNIARFATYAKLGPAAIARRVICLDDGLSYESASAAARHYGVHKSTIIEVCLGKPYRKTAGGFRFKYVEAA